MSVGLAKGVLSILPQQQEEKENMWAKAGSWAKF